MTSDALTFGRARLTRVGYMDIPVPAELLGLSADAVNDITWAAPTWAENGHVNIGAAAWVAESGGKRLVFDPMMALDVVLRATGEDEARHQQAVAEAFARAGFDRESVDFVVLSHIEGIGMIGWHDGEGNWVPFFPNATILLSKAEIDAFHDGDETQHGPAVHPWRRFIDLGLVSPIESDDEIVPDIRAEVRAGHSPGHTVYHLGGAVRRPGGTFIGHLAVSPLHLVTGPCESLNQDAGRAYEFLQETAADGRMLIGPLWPAPGHGALRNNEIVIPSGAET